MSAIRPRRAPGADPIRRPFPGPIRHLLPLVPLLFSGLAWGNDFTLSGFGTTGLSCFSSDEAHFVADYLQPDGPGRGERCTSELDSMLGLQLSGSLGDSLDYDLQAISKLTAQGNYNPSISLGLLSWHANADTTIRIGRTSNPNFLYSESRNVRFVMPWTRPPVDLYSLSPVLQYDGIDLLYNTAIGDWATEFHLGASVANEDFLITQTNDLTESRARVLHANVTLQQPAWTLKFGITQGQYSATPPTFEQVLNTVIAPFDASLAQDLKVKDSDYRLLTASAAYRDHGWFVLGELGIDKLDSLVVLDSVAGYLTVGRETGPWTTYATVAKRWNRSKDDHRADGLPIGPLVRNILDSRDNETRTVSFGVSRALSDTAIVKVQLDWMSPSSGSSGGWVNLAPGTDLGDPGNELLISINLDFVF